MLHASLIWLGLVALPQHRRQHYLLAFLLFGKPSSIVTRRRPAVMATAPRVPEGTVDAAVVMPAERAHAAVRNSWQDELTSFVLAMLPAAASYPL